MTTGGVDSGPVTLERVAEESRRRVAGSEATAEAVTARRADRSSSSCRWGRRADDRGAWAVGSSIPMAGTGRSAPDVHRGCADRPPSRRSGQLRHRSTRPRAPWIRWTALASSAAAGQARTAPRRSSSAGRGGAAARFNPDRSIKAAAANAERRARTIFAEMVTSTSPTRRSRPCPGGLHDPRPGPARRRRTGPGRALPGRSRSRWSSPSPSSGRSCCSPGSTSCRRTRWCRSRPTRRSSRRSWSGSTTSSAASWCGASSPPLRATYVDRFWDPGVTRPPPTSRRSPTGATAPLGAGGGRRALRHAACAASCCVATPTRSSSRPSPQPQAMPILTGAMAPDVRFFGFDIAADDDR